MKDFAKNYIVELSKMLDDLHIINLEKIKKTLLAARDNNQQIFILGNGGSAATASHIANDLNKGVLGHTGEKNIKRFKVISLNDNISLLTAWANDTSFDNIFSEQISNLANSDDIVIAISASGNSKNITRAVKNAKEKGCIVIGFAGFDGGELEKLADYSLTVKIKKYDIVEDVHLILGHIMTRWFYENI